MRIIAGKHKGRLLASPKNQDIRPTADRIRENVFNILQGRIANSTLLDLFAGTGAIGLEALSRGARVVFNDVDKQSVALIKRNILTLNEQCEVLNMDYQDALQKLEGREFDIIYLDPPYKMDIVNVLELIKRYSLVQEGIVIYERDANSECTCEGYERVDQRKYGKTILEFLRINDERVLSDGKL